MRISITLGRQLTAAAFSAVLFFTTSATAQRPAVLDSQALKKTRTCLDNLKADAQKANLYVDLDTGTILVQHSTSRDALLPLLVSMSNCLDDAFEGKKEIVKNPRTGVQSRIWYVKVDEQYLWCATESLANDLKNVDVLGGHGPRRQWPSIIFVCKVDPSILGFYKPHAAVPALPPATIKNSVQHAESCTNDSWGFLAFQGYRFGTVNTCQEPVTIWFMPRNGSVVEATVKGRGVFTTGYAMDTYRDKIIPWISATCPSGYKPRPPLSYKDSKAFDDSSYQCVAQN